jgi:hypothetical protein
VIYNDRIWAEITNREFRDDRVIVLEHGKPMIYGKDQDKGLRLKNNEIEVVQLGNGITESDLLVHDAQYSLAQRATYSNYGHSSWKEATEVASMAGVDCLALFHYDPDATDDDMDLIRLQAQQLFPRTILSREDLLVNLPISDDLIAVT